MRNFLLVGLMAAATMLMSADVVFAGDGKNLEQGGKDKGKGKSTSTSIKFTYPLDAQVNQPDLVVLVLPGRGYTPSSVSDLKQAIGIEPGGEYSFGDLKPGEYTVWLFTAENLNQLVDNNPDDTFISIVELENITIKMNSYTLRVNDELKLFISPTGISEIAPPNPTTLPAGN